MTAPPTANNIGRMTQYDLYPEDIAAAESFLSTYCAGQLDAIAQGGQTHLSVSYRDLTTDDGLQKAAKDHGLLDMAAWIDIEPEAVRTLLSEAVAEHDFGVPVEIEPPTIRITDLPDDIVLGVDELWQAETGEFCGVRGQVQKRDSVRKEAVELAYKCQRCGTKTTMPVESGATEPAQCQGCERQGPFDLDHDDSEFRPYQLVRVQQPPEESAGSNASHTDVPLRGPLVGSVEPGDRAVFAGKQQMRQAGDEDELLFDPYLEPESVAVEETDFEEIDTDAFREEIAAIADGEYGAPAEAIVDSIAPKVHGHDELKLAMALQLVGGRAIDYPDGARDRGDIHVLLIGAPGTAKSTLLEASEELAPRSTYASGKGASAAGMTAAAVRDDFGETEWALEAGALVLANNGIACVDEIDKVEEDARSSLHTALESQRINVNKAGINATLPAETSLFAAGNPMYGRFDQYASESISEQIDLGPTLLSRFDLIFMLQDKPDREDDTAIARHIIESGRAAAGVDDAGANPEPTLPADVLRAYIAYAKQEVQPTIEDDAVTDDLVESFVDWRLLNGDSEDVAVPVTFRKLEGVRRLAQASARLRLSETVEQRDIDRARELVMTSMRQVGFDEDGGTFDADLVEAGASKSQRDRVQTIKEIIANNAPDFEQGVPTGRVKERAEDAGIPPEKADYHIAKLKQQGVVYEPSDGCLRCT